MDARKWLKSWLPPAIVESRHSGRLFPSWEAAAAAASSYEDSLVNKFRIDRAALRPIANTPDATGLLGLTIRALGIADATITDFGGAVGELALNLIAAFPAAKYTVVENAKLISLIQPLSGIEFTTEIPSSCDVFFSSGTLQYLRNPTAVLEKGFASARHAVVLARNSFSDKKLYRVHKARLFRNGSGPIPPGYQNVVVSYPHQTICERDVQMHAEREGFQCIAALEEHSGVLPYRGQVYGRQLVYLRK